MDETNRDHAGEELVAELHALRARVASLERSEAILKAAIEGFAVPAFAKDERGRYTMITPGAASLIRQEPARIIGRHAREFLPPDLARQIEEGDARVLSGAESQGRDPEASPIADERTYLVIKAAHRDDRGQIAGLVGIAGDITEWSRQAEAFRAIFENIPAVICFVEPGGRLRLVNREWERVLGWSLEEATTRDVATELFPDPDRRREALEYASEPGRGWKAFRVRARDGRTIEMAWTYVPLPDGTSVGIGVDVGEWYGDQGSPRVGERRFRAAFEMAFDPMILSDDDGCYVDANPAALAMFGMPRDPSRSGLAVPPSGSGPGADVAWASCRSAGSAQGSFRLDRPDGGTLEIEFARKPDVLPGRHLSVMRDVTDRVRAEEAHREAERRVIAILESITEGFFTLDSRWRFSFVNQQAEAYLGRSRQELLGRVVWEAFPEAVGTEFDRQYYRSVADQVPVAFEVEYPPLGRWFRVQAHPWADGLSVFFDDVTERHDAEEALRRSERRFRQVLENSRDVIYQLNLSTRTYEYVSPSSREVLGFPADELAVAGLSRLISAIHPQDLGRLEGHLASLLEPEPGAGLGPVLDYRLRVPRKGWRWMNDSVTVVRDEGGVPVAVVGSVRDVTERRMAAGRLRDLSRRLIRAQEEERRHIARELHDEIGQALTAIKLDVRGALRDPGSPTAARRLEEAIGLVDRTIGQVRDLSLDLRPSMLDDLGLVDALRSYVSGFAERLGLASEFVASGVIGRLDPDLETACYRIVQEALTNVARHSGAGRIHVELARSGTDVRLLVADDGPGFDVAAATARAAGGASLGVLGMKERATLVGGRLEIVSGTGLGTEVHAVFPSGWDRTEPADGPPGV